MLRPQWKKLRYRFLFYHKSALNCPKTFLMITWLHVYYWPLFPMVKRPVSYPELLITFSNHRDVTKYPLLFPRIISKCIKCAVIRDIWHHCMNSRLFFITFETALILEAFNKILNSITATVYIWYHSVRDYLLKYRWKWLLSIPMFSLWFWKCNLISAYIFCSVIFTFIIEKNINTTVVSFAIAIGSFIFVLAYHTFALNLKSKWQIKC